MADRMSPIPSVAAPRRCWTPPRVHTLPLHGAQVGFTPVIPEGDLQGS